MKIMKEEKITVSLTKEELSEAIVFWLSRSRGTTETCKIACYIHNDKSLKMKFSKGVLTIETKGSLSEDEI
tara:strand:+ start:281 stop:493 length:213 start_codon:yes stop_codon:yes gene_type:complete